MFGFEYVCTCVVSLSANYSVSTWFSTGHAVVQYTSLSVTVSLFIFFHDLYCSSHTVSCSVTASLYACLITGRQLQHFGDEETGAV